MITLCYSISLWIASRFLPESDKDVLAFMLIGLLPSTLVDFGLFVMLILVLTGK